MALAKFLNSFEKWVRYGDRCFHCANYNRSYTDGSYRRYSSSVVSDASPFSVTGGVPHNVECSNPLPDFEGLADGLELGSLLAFRACRGLL